jgi:hypothetical protein
MDQASQQGLSDYINLKTKRTHRSVRLSTGTCALNQSKGAFAVNGFSAIQYYGKISYW